MITYLLRRIPRKIKIIDPLITGESKYSKLAPLEIIIIGFPPAGGWVTFKNIMIEIPKPTAKGIIIKTGKEMNFKNKIPINEVIKCPKNMFLGFENGLSG